MNAPFALICCINLRRRDDRWRAFERGLPRPWPLGKVRRYPAIEGKRCPPPDWWKESPGAWGCYRSHLGIIEDCLNNGIESVCVFEDDAVFPLAFADELQAFLRHVPDDWQMLYFGGQLLKAHFRPPQKINDWVYRPFNVNRSHAYAVRGEGLARLYRHLTTLDWYENYHVDHHCGRLHEDPSLRVYCPRRWLVGQTGGASDISGATNETTYWNHAEDCYRRGKSTLVVVLGLHRCGSSALAMMLHHLGLFLGDELGGYEPSGGGEDQRLARLCERIAPFPTAGIALPEPELRARLGDWLGHHLWRAECVGKRAAAKYPHLCALGKHLHEFCGDALQVIHIDRPLAESIDSLRRRSRASSDWLRVSDEAAERVQCWLWQEKEKLLAALRSAGQPALDVRMHELLSDPAEQVRRIVSHLGLEASHDQQAAAVAHVRQPAA